MESQPHNSEFRINPETFTHVNVAFPGNTHLILSFVWLCYFDIAV